MQLHTFPPPPPSFYKLSTSWLSVSQCDNGVFPLHSLSGMGILRSPFQKYYQCELERPSISLSDVVRIRKECAGAVSPVQISSDAHTPPDVSSAQLKSLTTQKYCLHGSRFRNHQSLFYTLIHIDNALKSFYLLSTPGLVSHSYL